MTTEPVTFQRIFGKLRSGFDYSDLGFKAADIVELDAEDRIALIIDLVSQQIAEHCEKLTNLYKRISVEHIEEVRRDFCKHAELLDPSCCTVAAHDQKDARGEWRPFSESLRGELRCVA